MRTFCFLLCIVYANCYYEGNILKHKKKIVEGEFTEIEEIPYQASIYYYKTINYCGAVIIDKSWILTAAHCVANRTNLTVGTGTSYSTTVPRGILHNIKRFILHPKFNRKTGDNDIALLELEKPMEINEKQSPIPIAHPNDIPKTGQAMLVSGFGRLGKIYTASTMLMSTYVPVVNQRQCTAIYARLGDPITSNMFCAGDGIHDACDGDSGGPGVIKGKLFGIIANGYGCADPKYPGVYMRVDKYYNWTVKTTRR